MLNEITKEPIFGVTITLAAYAFGDMISKKTKSPLANPLLIASVIIIAFLLGFKIPIENYQNGSKFLDMLIAPATTALALSMYKNYDIIKKNLSAIVVGCFAGALTAVVSVIALSKLFGVSEDILNAMLPKSVTMAIALQVSQQRGAMVPLTSAAVFFTGFFVGVAAPWLIKIFKVKNPVAKGLALGASGHAFATAKAIEIGEIEGALSGIAIGMCGISTVIILAFI